MRTRRLTSPAVLAVALPLVFSACTYQQSTEFYAPTAPTLPAIPAPPGGGAGPLTGIWAAEADFTSPESWSCTGFQWNVSEQTATSISGSFIGVCSGIVLVTGTASGQLDDKDVTIHVEGTASLQDNVVTCEFALDGVGHIVSNDEMLVEYEGTTCFGPVSGEETLRRPAPDEPPPPPPAPPAPEPPAPESVPSNPNHVGPGALTEDRAERVVEATGEEFPHLLRAFSTEAQSRSAAEQLLLRTIWHLELAGFNAARQRNPSGTISNDKLTIHIGGRWRAYDIFRAYGTPGEETEVIFFEVSPPNPVDHPGIPD
jgi:hypothetical protein